MEAVFYPAHPNRVGYLSGNGSFCSEATVSHGAACLSRAGPPAGETAHLAGLATLPGDGSFCSEATVSRGAACLSRAGPPAGETAHPNRVGNLPGDGSSSRGRADPFRTRLRKRDLKHDAFHFWGQNPPQPPAQTDSSSGSSYSYCTTSSHFISSSVSSGRCSVSRAAATMGSHSCTYRLEVWVFSQNRSIYFSAHSGDLRQSSR